MNCPFENMKSILDNNVQVVTSHDLYPTPPQLVRRMIDMCDIEEGSHVLEPSGGTGSIIRELPPCIITTCEINTDLCDNLSIVGDHECRVHNMDFLDMHLVRETRYDFVLMNPPFSKGADIKHIKHALRFLKQGGRLVAICAGGPRQERELQPLCTSWEPLPQGTFKQAGTMVNTVLICIDR